MITNRARTPKNANSRGLHDDNVKWRLETESEASVLGNQFAQVVSLVASGSVDKLIEKKKVYPSCKKIFWEEVRFNPALENANDSYAHDAHRIEETQYWKKGGQKFFGAPRFSKSRNESGPLAPTEFANLFEKPTVVFERSGVLHPFSRAKQFNRPQPSADPEKVKHTCLCIYFISDLADVLLLLQF